MEQYMDASQSLLSSVHGDSLTSREEVRQAGAREGQVLDDVVIVKVGRSVKSVYDEEGERDWLERTTRVCIMLKLTAILDLPSCQSSQDPA